MTCLGALTSVLAASDSLSATLVGPDTVALVFTLPDSLGLGADCFLLVEATQLDPSTLASNQLKAMTGELPLRFALEQNRPNPFTRGTTIRFALPTAAPVRLEVFDAAGRRVRTLALGPFAPGYHQAEWDHRDVRGNLVRPGVYLYRLIAGSFRDQKKMVLLAN